jgi:hypothetical protein
MIEELIGLGAFGFLFGGAFLLGLVEFLGKVYGTYSCFARQDLSGEQRIIYLAIIWFIPFGWLIYLVLGKERTKKTFSEVEFL